MKINHISFFVNDLENIKSFYEKYFKVLSQPKITGDGYYESSIYDPENNQTEIVE